MATAVTHSNLFNQAWTEIYNLINSNHGSDFKGIYSQWPDKPLASKSDYPLAIISRVRVAGDEFVSFDLRDAVLNCDIEIYSTQNSQLDSLSSSVYGTLRDSTIDLSADSKLEVLSIVDSADDDIIRNRIKLHVRRMTIEFRVIGSVS